VSSEGIKAYLVVRVLGERGARGGPAGGSGQFSYPVMLHSYAVRRTCDRCMFACCLTMTRYTTHPSADHEQSVWFYSRKSPLPWPCQKFSNSSTVPTRIPPSFPLSSPASSTRKGSKTTSQSLETRTSYGQSNIWTVCLSIALYLLSAQSA